jgi:uncharacterized protein
VKRRKSNNNQQIPNTYIIVPSTLCPATCKYCFGPRQNSKNIMTVEVLKHTVDFIHKMIQNSSNNTSIQIIFHGGEPLTVGSEFFSYALQYIKNKLVDSHIRLNIQSNLWLLTDNMCRLFYEYNVSITTSIDGPEEINDFQRCTGYFKQTIRGINLARRYGLFTGCIATFTSYSAKYMDEIYTFFSKEGIDFNIHPAVLSLSKNNHEWILPPEEYIIILQGMLDKYINDHIRNIRIDTIHELCYNIVTNNGCSCTFIDCLGNFIAIAPDGGIYPCQRFILDKRFCLGNVLDTDIYDIYTTDTWQRLQYRVQQIQIICSTCLYLPFCKGGCMYNAISMTGCLYNKDPYCTTYKQIYTYIIDQAISEVFSEENLNQVVNNNTGGLFQHGALLDIMKSL